MILVLRLVMLLIAATSLLAAVLVTASLFIADRAPQSSQFLAISLVVSAFFAATGALAFGLQRQMARLRDAGARLDGAAAERFAPPFHALARLLLAGGTILAPILLLATYVILARIDQGFAVFG
ncbi:hypothetical protein [Rubrimonas cliftonensis]|uniref:Uncharacterized protein n=1 Tax=Rubrimonas cliftonensis TaxID=89524 RepID=A0A1H4FR12_9RHOB|nr:hypothetical protein [Rubrimonas cliftonensis]SEA99250.1 hypothetical protein SAMN05444370_12624 [Rubrimonas cliftonensis]